MRVALAALLRSSERDLIGRTLVSLVSRAERDNVANAVLAASREIGASEVEIGDSEGDQLHAPDAGRVRNFQKRSIPEPLRCGDDGLR